MGFVGLGRDAGRVAHRPTVQRSSVRVPAPRSAAAFCLVQRQAGNAAVCQERRAVQRDAAPSVQRDGGTASVPPLVQGIAVGLARLTPAGITAVQHAIGSTATGLALAQQVYDYDRTLGLPIDGSLNDSTIRELIGALNTQGRVVDGIRLIVDHYQLAGGQPQVVIGADVDPAVTAVCGTTEGGGQPDALRVNPSAVPPVDAYPGGIDGYLRTVASELHVLTTCAGSTDPAEAKFEAAYWSLMTPGLPAMDAERLKVAVAHAFELERAVQPEQRGPRHAEMLAAFEFIWQYLRVCPPKNNVGAVATAAAGYTLRLLSNRHRDQYGEQVAATLRLYNALPATARTGALPELARRLQEVLADNGITGCQPPGAPPAAVPSDATENPVIIP